MVKILARRKTFTLSINVDVRIIDSFLNKYINGIRNHNNIYKNALLGTKAIKDAINTYSLNLFFVNITKKINNAIKRKYIIESKIPLILKNANKPLKYSNLSL